MNKPSGDRPRPTLVPRRIARRPGVKADVAPAERRTAASVIGQRSGTVPSDLVTLQNVIFPEDGVCTEIDLYFHLAGPGGYNHSKGELVIQNGATVLIDSYFNAFSMGKWHESCKLDGLYLGVTGKGLVELRVWQAVQDHSWELLASEVMTLSTWEESVIDLSHYSESRVTGVLYFEMREFTGKEVACLSSARYATRAGNAARPELAICITTFKREIEVRRTARRLEEFLTGFTYGEHIRVLVVDNGASAVIPATPHVELLENRNLGGAGGFSRGLIEAEARDCTHCLFMDDDASFHMENILRTYMFLMLARSKDFALAGAMINNTHKWAMWENGAIFDGSCIPQFCGLDLRRRDLVFDMEYRSAGEERANFYGGWWFFAFAIAHVTRRPFPFFVRGDDISFSMANKFRIVTLNGLTSFQDDFTEKESAQTLYLDLRSHLIHHIIFEKIDRGGLGTGKVALRFILRSLARFHYETAEAQLLSWQDVMRGPKFFAENADMAARRQTIKELAKSEVWKPVHELDLGERRKWTHRRGGFWEKLFIRTVNGSLLPFFGRWGDRIVLHIGDRGLLHPVWGAAQITYLNSTRRKGYTTRVSMRRFVSIGFRVAMTLAKFALNYRSLRETYRESYVEMTERPFWESLLGLPATTAEAAADQVATAQAAKDEAAAAEDEAPAAEDVSTTGRTEPVHSHG